ncbi:unnamed protein product [Ectocarpus sp. CCAP 1310/34]|nr:unnamed protein product [Ectocarpus sp. CCAP 1310/34]
MPAGANPVSRPVRIATAGHFLTFSSFSGTFPARSTPLPPFSFSCFSTTDGGGGGSGSKQRSLLSTATRHRPPLAAASLGLRGQQKPLLLGRRSARGSGLSAGWASGRLRMMSEEGGADGATSTAGCDKQEGGSDSGASGGGGGARTKGGRGGEAFPSVTLDADAVQKFAEIQVRWGGTDESSEPTILIRGLKSAKYHIEAAEPTMARLREAGADATVTGGGRIKHSSKRRSIFIYGYSMQFGPANLPRVADLCRKQFPSDYEVTWTEGGY